MALEANERTAAFAAARRYIDQHDAGLHVTDPMLNGLLDAVIAALEPIWAGKVKEPAPKAKAKAGDD